jgi:hypothetical protein
MQKYYIVVTILIVIAASGKDFALTELGVRDYVIASVIVKEGTLRMDLYRIMWARGNSSWGSPRTLGTDVSLDSSDCCST